MSSETTHSDLTALGDRLVGTWKVSGEGQGETSWEWIEGGTRPPPLEERRSMIDDIEEMTQYQVTAGG